MTEAFQSCVISLLVWSMVGTLYHAYFSFKDKQAWCRDLLSYVIFYWAKYMFYASDSPREYYFPYWIAIWILSHCIARGVCADILDGYAHAKAFLLRIGDSRSSKKND